MKKASSLHCWEKGIFLMWIMQVTDETYSVGFQMILEITVTVK